MGQGRFLSADAMRKILQRKADGFKTVIPQLQIAGDFSGTNVIQRFGIASLDFGRIALTEHALNFDPQVVGHHLLKSRHAPADKVIIKKLPDPAWAQPAP